MLGVGADATRLRPSGTGPTLRLQDPESSATELRLDGGTGPALQIDGGASRQLGARVRARARPRRRGRAVERGRQRRRGAPATPRRRGSTSTTRPSSARATPACAATARRPGARSRSSVDDSIVWGFAQRLRDRRDHHGRDRATPPTPAPPARPTPPPTRASPRPGDWRLRPDSPMIDAGRPGALSESESHEDALGYVRIVDGNGDGGAAARHRRPGGPAAGARPRPPGTCSPTRARRRARRPPTTARAPRRRAGRGPARSRSSATARSPGSSRSRRSGWPRRCRPATPSSPPGPGRDGTATQVASLADAAPEIDLGKGTVTLSALLGGYRGSADGAIAEAVFRGPRRQRARQRADRPGDGRRPRQRDDAAPARRVGRDPAADAHDRGDPALDAGRRAATTTRTSTTSRSCRGWRAGRRTCRRPPRPAAGCARSRASRCSPAAPRSTRAGARGCGWPARARS